MEFEGEDGVLTHYLMDVDNRLGDGLTVVSYTQRLGVLVCLLRDLCGVTELEQVEIKHLRQCVQHLLNDPVEVRGRVPRSEEGKLAISTVRSYIRVWKVFFNWCCQEELIMSSPAARLKPPKGEKRIKPTFTREYIGRMIDACDTSTPMGFRDYVILILMLDTGMRVAEVASLTVDAINVKGGYIKVFGKGRKEREIGIYHETGKLLWKYVHKYRKSSEPDEARLFIGRFGPLSAHGIQEVIKRIQRKSGLMDIEFHAHVFRHTFARMYLERGGDIFRLSREMGHSSIQVTKTYLEDFGSTEARKEHKEYSPIGDIQLKKSGKRREKRR